MKRSVPALVGVLVAGGLSAGTATATSAAEDEGPPAALAGEITDVKASGDVLATATVQPVVDPGDEPREGDPVDLLNLPSSAVTVGDGTFTLRYHPEDVPASHMDENGLVTFGVEFVNRETGDVAYHMASVRAVQTQGDGSVWADPLSAEWSKPDAGSRLATQRELPTAASDKVPPSPERAQVSLSQGRLSEAALEARTSDFQVMGGAICRYPGAETIRSATVGTSYPILGDTAWLEYGATSSTTFGAAVNWGNGWSASGARTLDDSWGQNFSPGPKPRSYRVRVKYRKQRCWDSTGSTVHTHWIPWYETGGTRVNILDGRPNWRTCEPVARGNWWRGKVRGTDYALSYGVKFKGMIGINLRTRRAYSADSRLYYSLPTARKLCGNNGKEPAIAGKIRERRWKWNG